jgi:dolichol-phosphate mannosyltransferase
LSTKGYSFQSSLICDLVWRGAVASEIPIIFNSRKDGDSKLSFEDQLEFLFNIPRLGFRNMEDFIKYSIVGLSGVVLNLGIYTLLTRYFEFSELLAPIISIESALISNFMLNNIWTFGKRTFVSRTRVKFLKFHLVSGFAAIINYLVFLVLLLSFGVYDILANLIGIALAAVVNYLINSNWTWKNSK